MILVCLILQKLGNLSFMILSNSVHDDIAIQFGESQEKKGSNGHFKILKADLLENGMDGRNTL